VYNCAVAGASIDMLKKVPLFAGLDDKELQEISLSMRERMRNLTPRGASSEKPPPRPGTTSMVRCVWLQYSNWAADIHTGSGSALSPISSEPSSTSDGPVANSPSG